MSIKTAVQSSLTSPRPGFGSAGAPSNPLADTLTDMADGVAEIERHAKDADPTNVALLAKLSQLKAALQSAAQSAEAGRARLGTAIRGPSSGSSGSSSKSPF
jgi:formiminotetrahydrofolate cyclodeaminase